MSEEAVETQRIAHDGRQRRFEFSKLRRGWREPFNMDQPAIVVEARQQILDGALGAGHLGRSNLHQRIVEGYRRCLGPFAN